MICQAKDCPRLAVPGLDFCDPHQEDLEEGRPVTRKVPRGRPAGPPSMRPAAYNYTQVAKRPGFRRCAATNKHNTRCINSARPGSDFCGWHQKMEARHA